jgi:hypothetical protein
VDGYGNGARKRFGCRSFGRHDDRHVCGVEQPIGNCAYLVQTPPSVALVADNDRDIADALSDCPQRARGIIVDENWMNRHTGALCLRYPIIMEKAIMLGPDRVEIDEHSRSKKRSQRRKGVYGSYFTVASLGYCPRERPFGSWRSVNTDHGVR